MTRNLVQIKTVMGRNVKFCGQIHKPRECPAHGQECHRCKKKNHWVNCCQTKKVQEASAAPSADFVIKEVGSNIEKQQKLLGY